jgi:hypothetical protein
MDRSMGRTVEIIKLPRRAGPHERDDKERADGEAAPAPAALYASDNTRLQ